MIALELLEVRDHGPIAVGYAVDDRGTETVVALDARLARDLAVALRAGQRPIVDVQPWQLLPGYPYVRRSAPSTPALPADVVDRERASLAKIGLGLTDDGQVHRLDQPPPAPRRVELEATR